MIRTVHFHFLTSLIKQFHLGPESFCLRLATPFRVDNHKRGQAGYIVHLLGDGHPLFDVFKTYRACIFGHDWTCVRIPVRQLHTRLNLGSIFDLQSCPIGNLMTFAFAAVIVGNQHLGRTGDDDFFIFRVGHITHRRRKANRTGAFCFDMTLCGSTRCRTTNVEGAHRQLCSWFANRLGSNNSDRLTRVD